MSIRMKPCFLFWFLCFCSNKLLLCDHNLWCICDCGSSWRAWFGQGRDWHGQSQLEISRAYTLAVCRHWDLCQGNPCIVKSYNLHAWLTLSRGSKIEETPVSVICYFSEGHNQDSHLGAIGNTDARHSQWEGERDKAVQPHQGKLSGTNAEYKCYE